MTDTPKTHLRIYWGRVSRDSWPSLEERYASLAQMPIDGLVSRYVARDVHDPENIFTVTFWESIDHIRKWEESDAYRDLYLASVSPYIVGSRSVSLCEVRIEQEFDAAR